MAKLLLAAALLAASCVARADVCRLAVFFGYNDQRPADLVVDGIQRTLLENRLTTACPAGGGWLCDWRRVSYADDGDYRRDLGAGRVLEISLRSASLTKSDDVNRGALRSAQDERSRRVRGEFLRSFAEAEFVFYVGHSRFGAGPDFAPARLRSSGAVDTAFYRGLRGASAREVSEVARSSARWSAFEVISCDSEEHFRGLFAGLGGSVGYVSIPVRPEEADVILARRLQTALGRCGF